jgi:riboflavin synthase
MVFTGIVQEIGDAQFDLQQNLLFVTPISDVSFWSRSVPGDSIAVNGVCLTLLSTPITTSYAASFFVMEETRSKTTLGLSSSSSSVKVNLEHALRVGDSMGGHTVSGHVDGRGRVSQVTPHEDGSRDVWVDLGDLPKLVVYKGSIALDGVSLTVAEIKDEKVGYI